MKYSGIEKAHLLIAHDNDGIYRGRTEEQATEDLYRYLKENDEFYSVEELQAINEWLLNLNEEDLSDLCTGDEEAQNAILKNAPSRAEDLIQEIFANVG